MSTDILERLRTVGTTGEEWADYRKLILSALTELKDSQIRTTERLEQNQQLTSERLAEYQRLTTERLAESQRSTADKIAEGLRAIGEKIDGQMTEVHKQVGDMRVKIAVLTVKMGLVGAVAGMLTGGAMAAALQFMLRSK